MPIDPICEYPNLNLASRRKSPATNESIIEIIKISTIKTKIKNQSILSVVSQSNRWERIRNFVPTTIQPTNQPINQPINAISL